jgi:hypothetical protein
MDAWLGVVVCGETAISESKQGFNQEPWRTMRLLSEAAMALLFYVVTYL